jgi:hypothetical protein
MVMLFGIINTALPAKGKKRSEAVETPVASAKGNPQLDVIDTPTASTLFKGGYDISLWGYNNGGIFTRAMMAIHDNILLGVSFDMQHVIGSDEIVFNIPGVIARAKLTDGWDDFPLLVAFGYDAFYANDKINPATVSWSMMRMIYGPYVVLTKPVFLLSHEQHVNMGLRVPAQPIFNPDDTSLFLSFDVPFGQFVPLFEIERIFFDSRRLSEVLFNVGLRFELGEDLAIELNLIMGINKPASRIVTFEYIGAF